MTDYIPPTPDEVALLPCGTTDHYAVLPPAVHYDCQGCKQIIVELLMARARPVKKAPPPVQTSLLDGAHPRRLKASR